MYPWMALAVLLLWKLTFVAAASCSNGRSEDECSAATTQTRAASGSVMMLKRSRLTQGAVAPDDRPRADGRGEAELSAQSHSPLALARSSEASWRVEVEIDAPWLEHVDLRERTKRTLSLVMTPSVAEIAEITEWFMRTGNNLYQIAHAILYAEATDRRWLRLPRPTSQSGLAEMFVLPEVLELQPHTGTKLVCQFSAARRHFYHICKGADKQQMSRVLRSYLLPLLSPQAKEACGREARRRPDTPELTVHLRSGDLLDSDHPQSHFAPCSFFERVIAIKGFRRVRVVAEDLRHPCVGELMARHPEADVQVGIKSLAEDACTLMHAEGLAPGALSTFFIVFGTLFNANASVFWPFLRMQATMRENLGCPEDAAVGGAACASSRAMTFCVPGWEVDRSLSSKLTYMTTVSADRISVHQCLPDLDTPNSWLRPVR